MSAEEALRVNCSTSLGATLLLVLATVLLHSPQVAAAEPVELTFDDLLRRTELLRPDYVERKEKRTEDIEYLGELANGRHRGERWPELVFRLAQRLEEHGRLERSMPASVRSVALFRMLLRDHPDAVPLDEILYRLAAILSADEGVEGEALLRQVVEEYPQSRFVPLALLRLAEIASARGDDNLARTALDASANWDFDEAGFAIYKLGWVYQRSGRSEEALDTMLLAVTRSTATLDPVARDTALDWAVDLNDESAAIDALTEMPVRTGTCRDEIDAGALGVGVRSGGTESLLESLAAVTCLEKVGEASEYEEAVDYLALHYGRGSFWYETQSRSTRRLARVAIRHARKPR